MSMMDIGTKKGLYEMLGVREYFLFDPLDVFVAPGEPLAACVRMENDHRAVGRAAADYFLARGFRHFAFAPAVLSSNPQMRGRLK